MRRVECCGRLNSSSILAMLMAMRRASSCVNSKADDRLIGAIEIKFGN
jgi:hypothetical protein